MKKLILTFAIALVSVLGFSQEENGVTLTVTVENAKNNNGTMLVGLHTEENFMKGAGVDNQMSKIVDGKATVTFKNVKPGEYAIMVLHDENDNKKMDFEDNGMPKESYGMSNNPRSFGPPLYADAKFEVSGADIEMSIRF
ncbi:MAG: DUF2141 domain-containing protein [Bacteroidota bacterium]